MAKNKIVPIKPKSTRKRVKLNQKASRVKERSTLIAVLTFPINPFPSTSGLSKAHKQQLHIMRVLRATLLDCVETPIPVKRGIVGVDTLVNVSDDTDDTSKLEGNDFAIATDNVKVIDSNRFIYRLFFSVSINVDGPQAMINVLRSRGIDEVYSNVDKSGNRVGRVGLGLQNPDNPAPSKLPKRCYSGAIARKLERLEKDKIGEMSFLNYVYGTSFPDSSIVPYKGIELTMRDTLEIVARRETNSPLPANWNSDAKNLAFWFNALNRHYKDYCQSHLSSARINAKSSTSNEEREYWNGVISRIIMYVENFGNPIAKDANGKLIDDGMQHAAIRADNVESIVKETLNIDSDADIREVIIVDGIPTRIARKPTPQENKLTLPDFVIAHLESVDDEPIGSINVPQGKNMSECVAWWNGGFGIDLQSSKEV